MRFPDTSPTGITRVLTALLATALACPSAAAVDLKPKSVETFDRYVRLTEARVSSEVSNAEAFLWPDAVPEPRRSQLFAQLKRGEVAIESLKTLEGGEPIEDGDSLIHHWVGVVFISGAKLGETLELIQDYDHHAAYFAPDVARSRILAHSGNDFRTAVRFMKKKVFTVVLDTEHDIQYAPQDSARVSMRAVATRIAEVENPGKPGERELPPGHDGGYMWRLNTYWRFQERDGGVYVQCESITLTRDIPAGLGWLIGPYVKSVPRESLQFTLGTLRRILLERAAR